LAAVKRFNIPFHTATTDCRGTVSVQTHFIIFISNGFSSEAKPHDYQYREAQEKSKCTPVSKLQR